VVVMYEEDQPTHLSFKFGMKILCAFSLVTKS